MKTLITCDSSTNADFIFDLLTDPQKGSGPLAGKKICTDDHTLIPTIIEFDLTRKEIEELKNIPGVKSVQKIPNHLEPVLYTGSVINQECKPRQALVGRDALLTDPLIAPHSLYYSQCSEAVQNDSEHLNENAQSVTLKFIDCSNVDIIIVDSGVDAAHVDFNSSASGVSRVVDFDWGAFQEWDPKTSQFVPIIKNWQDIRAAFLIDQDGHGTACASLAAGNRCGFAKNSAIYSMKIFENGSIDTITAMKCLLAFINAKKQNLNGLDSTRPTIISNSWGYNARQIIPQEFGDGVIDETHDTLLRFSGAAAASESESYMAGLIGCPEVPSVDAYVRQIVAAGGHFLNAAGNDNAYLDNSNQYVLPYHLIIDSDASLYDDRESRSVMMVVPGNTETDKMFEGQGDASVADYGLFTDFGNSWTYKYAYYGKEQIGFYISPGVGIGYSKNDFPIITVGDVSAVGDYDTSYSAWSKACFIEPMLTGSDDRVKINSNIRYRSYDGPKFVRSYYSNFGPYVDIYAHGNATYAARSSLSEKDPQLVISEQEKYVYFNGTSAATPIVAGILASYLAENPTATPDEAKNWLITNGSKGNILETTTEKRSIVNSLGARVDVDCPLIDWAKAKHFYWQFSFNSTRENYLHLARFYNSNNIIAQAYPLRNGVFEGSAGTVNLAGSQLSLEQDGLTESKTHSLSTSPPSAPIVLFSDSDNHLLPEEIRDFFILAKNRWKQFVSIKPEMLASIRERIPDFDGIKISLPHFQLEVNANGMGALPIDFQTMTDPTTGKKSYCTVSYALSVHYTPGTFGFGDGRNRARYNSIVHELGHALGIAGDICDKEGFNGNAAIFPRPTQYNENGVIWPDLAYTSCFYLSGEEFPKTLEAYRQIHNTNNNNVPLFEGGGHWVSADASYLTYANGQAVPWKIEGQTYVPTRHYDLMSYGELTDTRIITKLSIYHLLDYGGYYERNPGVYETNENYIPPWAAV